MGELLNYIQSRRAQQPQDAPVRAALAASEIYGVEDVIRAGQLANGLGATPDLTLAAPNKAQDEFTARLLEAVPSLAGWAGQSVSNVVLAKDEPETLGGIYNAVTAEPGTLPPITGQGTISEYKPGAVEAIGQAFKEGTSQTIQNMAGSLLQLLESNTATPGMSYGHANPVFIDEGVNERFADEAANVRGRIQAARDNAPPPVQVDSTIGNYGLDLVRMAPQLFGQAVSSIAGGPVGGVAFMGSQIAGGQYVDLTENGVSPERAFVASLANAGLQAPLEQLGFSRLTRIFKQSTAGKIAAAVGGQIFTEFATETLQSLPEDLTTRWAEAELSGQSIEDVAKRFFDDLGDTLLEGAYEGLVAAPFGLIGGGVQVARIRQADSFVRQQLAINEKVTASQLYQRSPEKMREMLDSAGPVMSQVVTLPRSALEGDALFSLTEADVVDNTVSVPLSELHARLKPEQFRKISDQIAPVDGLDLVTVRRKFEKRLGDSIGKAVQARDAEAAVNAATGLAAAGQATEDLRARLMAERESARVWAADALPAEAAVVEGETAPDTTETEDRGIAYAPAQAVESFFQTALSELDEMDAIDQRLALLDGLGITPDEYESALAAGGELEIDLNNFNISSDPMWDGFVNILEAQPVEITREMQADLEAFGPPPAILDRAGADVTPETRTDLTARLTAAGRTSGQANRETEVFSRLASTLSRITGQDPNELVRNTFRFGREGAEGAVSYFQPSLSAAYVERVKKSNESFKDTMIGKRVVGYRYGKSPESGRSFNSQTNRYEAGVSMASVVGLPEINSFAVYGRKAEGAKKYFYEGTINGIGGDDEFTLENVKQINAKEYREKIKGNSEDILKWTLDRVLYVSRYYGNQLDGVNPDDPNGFFYKKNVNIARHLDEHIDSIFKRIPSKYHKLIEQMLVDKQAELKPLMLFQPSAQGPRGRTDFLSDDTINIIFTESQDASTAVHEFAHAFRELIGRTLALPPGQIVDQTAFDTLKEGWAAAESWLARFDDEATLQAEYDKYFKSLYGGKEFGALIDDERASVLTRAKHEYFARGFEQYLMEGTAPTSGLKKLFSQMKRFLVKAYEAVAGNLDVELNDDVRRFFDSILATDEELAVESWRAEAVPNPDQLEMMREADPQAVTDYEAAVVKGREEAARQIIEARVKERAMFARRWRREGLKAAREDERIRRVDDIKKSGGISRSSLTASGYDAESIGQLSRRFPGLVNSTGSVGIDEHAENFGLDGGDALFHALMDTPTIVQLQAAYVEQQDAEWEEYFDADLGITDAEIDAWEAEKNLWAKFMASKGSKYAPRPARGLKAFIENQFDGLTVDEIKRQNSDDLRASLKAQARAAKEAYAAGEEASRTAGLIAEGRAKIKWNQAKAEIRAKALEQRQLLALRLRGLAARQRELAKFEANARRLIRQKPASATRPGGILPDFHGQIKNILAAAGLGNPVETAESLTDFVTRLEADGEPVAVDPAIISGTMFVKPANKKGQTRRTYKALTWEEFNNLRDAVDSLAFMGRRAQQVRVDGVLQSETHAANALINGITANHPLTISWTADDVQDERMARGPIEKAKIRWKKWRKRDTSIMPSSLKWQHLSYELDGQVLGGVAQQTFYNSIDKAANMEILLQEQYMRRMKEITESTVGKKAWQAWASERIYIEEYGRTFSRAQMIAAALNYGNLQNRTALNNHSQFKGKGPEPLLRHMTGKEWDFVQAFWDFQDNEVFTKLNALTLRTKGVPLRKVEADAFDVVLADGSIKQLRGGYYPLVFDRQGGDSPIAEERIKADELKAMPTLFTPKSIQASSTIARTGTSYKDLYPLLDLGVMVTSLNDNITDLAYREAVADAWRILKRPDVKAAVSGSLGEDAWMQGKLWLYNMVNGGRQSGNLKKGERIARVLRRNVARAAMALKISVVFMQFTGAFQSAQVLGYPWTMRGFASLYTPDGQIKARLDALYNKSPQLKYRNAQSYDRDITAALTSGADPLYKKGVERATEIMFKPIGFTDQLIAAGVWNGAYQKALSLGKDEAHAVTDADATLSLTQAPARNKDMSFAQQGWGSEWGRLLTMFQTFFSSARNLQWLASRQAGREAGEGRYGKAAKAVGFAALNLLVLQSFFNALMLDPVPDDDEGADEWAGRLALGTVTGTISSGFSGFPVLRDIMGAITSEVVGQYRPALAISPIEGAINNAFRAPGVIERMASGKTPVLTGTTQLVRNLGPAVGLPGSSQLANTLEGVDEWDDNDGFEKFYRLLIREPNK